MPPTFCRGDLASEWGKADLFCFTVCSTLKKDGSLVMGRGMARTVADKCPDAPQELGEKVRDFSIANNNAAFYFLTHQLPDQKVGLFQTRLHFSHRARFDLIWSAINRLRSYAGNHSDHRITMNFPGVGQEKLYPSEVMPLLMQLPDNVEIWSQPRSNQNMAEFWDSAYSKLVARYKTIGQQPQP